MSKERDEARLELLERAQSRINFINKSCVFKADYESVRIMESMILEIKILAHENRNHKKLINHNRLFIKKQEYKIKILKEKLNRAGDID